MRDYMKVYLANAREQKKAKSLPVTRDVRAQLNEYAAALIEIDDTVWQNTKAVTSKGSIGDVALNLLRLAAELKHSKSKAST